MKYSFLEEEEEEEEKVGAMDTTLEKPKES
jgi:hypothetical protein